LLLQHVEDEPRYLRRKNGKVVGKNYEKNAEGKPVLMLPEIFIQRPQMPHEGSKVKS
jgi:hypothetical protein